MEPKWMVFVIVSFGMFATTLEGTIVLVVYPVISEFFNTSASTVAWIGIGYFLTSCSLLMTMGWLCDLWGGKRVYVAGTIIFSITLFLISFSQNVYHIILLRSLQGIGAAMVISSSTALIASQFSKEERGKVFGLSGAVVGLGLGLGPLIGGLLIEFIDWKSVFYTRVPLSIICLLLSVKIIDQNIAKKEIKLDLLGSFYLFILLGSLLFVISQINILGYLSPLIILSLVLFIVFTPIFLYQELHSEFPVVQINMFKNPVFLVSIITLLLIYQSWNTIGYITPFVTTHGMGYSIVFSGFLLSIFSLVRIAIAPIAGRLTDIIGSKILIFLSVILLIISLILLSFAIRYGASLEIGLVLALASIAFGLFDPANNTAVVNSVPQDRLGMASASIATARQTGLAIGIAFSSGIFGSRLAHYNQSSIQNTQVENINSDLVLLAANDTIILSAAVCALTLLVFVFWIKSHFSMSI
ncbi:MAG: MFS transporter [SAR202 cluster bacterium]|nr:MFS transporter [SAR202 cluster bacterium]